MSSPFRPAFSASSQVLNPSGRAWRRLVLGLSLAVTAVGWGAPKQPDLVLEPHAILPAMRVAAEAAKMNLSGMAAAERRQALRPGDQVTALLTLTKGKKVKQWVVELTADELTKEERDRPAQAITLYSLSGRQFTYGLGLAALKIRIVGPVDGTGKTDKKAAAPAVQERRITVSADYLAMGLDQVAAANARVVGLLKQDPMLKPGDAAISETRFPADKLATEKARSKTGMIEITEAEERARGGAMLALQEFFATAQLTPGLQEVLLSVLDVPWWSIVRSGGKLNYTFDDQRVVKDLSATGWGLAAGEKLAAVCFVMEINGKPALVMLLAVTAPRPPLMAGAGIVGFAARGLTRSVLTMQIVSSRAAATVP
ncbi:MAG: hypothetical protein JSS11_07695 [Verrucomicrobia bacterium]|nr:hypothetical protein [Verrucomicrobiota bacterium]